MRFFEFPIVRFSLFLSLGISCSAWQSWNGWFVIGAICLPLLIVTWVMARKNLFQKPFFGLITYLSFFCLGASNYQLRSPDYQKSHYTHFISLENNDRLALQILSNQKPTKFSYRFIAEVKSVNSSPVHGKILVHLQKDSMTVSPSPGEELIVFAHPEPLEAPLNPGQFDYAEHLRSKDIFRQLRIRSSDVIACRTNGQGFTQAIHRLRYSLLKKLEGFPFGEKELSILKALTLGHKNSIDKDLYTSYASAGAIHVLAVSGLHVGIIYFFLNWLFRPLLFVPGGRNTRVIFIVISLLFYAMITGMSPSVTRAVSMFSFFGLARLLNRPTNSINTLFLSFFFLLLWNPKWMFDVGFQLSYAAVFFILWLHPKITSLYRPRFYVDKVAWNTLSVSFCAQLGVAPLSIFYFNQFPGLFLLSNLLVLPIIGLLVGGGLFLLILAAMDIDPNWLAACIDWILKLLNRVVVWVSEQDQFIFRDLVISEIGILTSYGLIVGLIITLAGFNVSRLRYLLLSIIVFLITISPLDFQNKSERLVILHKHKSTLIGIQKSRSLLILKQDSSSAADAFPIQSFRRNIQARWYSEKIIPPVFSFKEFTIMVIDSTGVYPENGPVDLVLLSGSPRIHLDLLIDKLKPGKIVADGSNYRSYIDRWREEL